MILPVRPFLLVSALISLTQAVFANMSYQHDIRPILEQKCIACHGCYDAPCQLKLESPQGLDRGANKALVYDGTRTKTVEPTRLFVDAQSTEQWRQRGFFSVLDSHDGGNSVIQSMLNLGYAQPFEPNSKLPNDIAWGIGRENTCPKASEFSRYEKKHPLEGMPLGTTGLTDAEYATLQTWFNQGAPVDDGDIVLSTAEKASIAQWEALLNFTDNRHFLVARWLYEHLYLAHLYFEDISGKPRFFQLVRSTTAPGESIHVIPTAQANQDPNGPFWYRLQPIRGSLVHKTHITFSLSENRLARVNALFFSGDWKTEKVQGYQYENRSNPFITFADIPAKARYQFMLDEAEYFIRTFIRGPVCRGQIATDVIRDHFWTFFQDPDHDLYINDLEYQQKATPLLGMPGQNHNLMTLGSEWLTYSRDRNRYTTLRNESYILAEPKGPTLAAIWDGDRNASDRINGNNNALLTIFRHHDNSSVRKGLIGAIPKTFWLMDFPLLERSYYELVVNFNVFGSVSHQAQTRLYFDLIRNGAEQNYLRLLPKESREDILHDWYQGMAKLKLITSYAGLPDQQPSGITYRTDAPLIELAETIIQQYRGINAVPHDAINRCGKAPCISVENSWTASVDQQLESVSARPAKTLPLIQQLPDFSLLTVKNKDGKTALYSMIRNRAHSNVAFMLGESLRYQPEQDTLTITPGILGSYPNFAFSVTTEDLPAFIASIQSGSNEEEDLEALTARWGVRRTHPLFWDYLQSYHDWLEHNQPIEAGILDINRYQNL